MFQISFLLVLLYAATGLGIESAHTGAPPDQASSGDSPTPDRSLSDRLIIVQTPLQGEPERRYGPVLTEDRPWQIARVLPSGSRIVLIDPSQPTRAPTLLTPGFSAAGRPDLSFDGRRVLFVGKRRPADCLNVWEIALEGGDARQITSQSRDCTAAKYLSALYSADTDELVHQICFATAAPGEVSALYTCRMDGTQTRRVTFGPNPVSDPLQLSDGRLLFTRHLENSGAMLFTVNTDGTDVSLFSANAGSHAIPGDPCETTGGQVIYVNAQPSGDRAPAGELVSVSRTRSLHTRRVVARDPAGWFRSPAALPDGNLMVSYCGTRDTTYGIYVLDPKQGVRTSLIIDTPEWNEVAALVVEGRHEPDGRSSVVDERSEHGLLYCLDAYLSDTPEGGRIRPGEIQRLQVFKPVGPEEVGGERTSTGPGDNTGPGWVGEELLGEIGLESDGSFQLQVPARTPLRLQTVAADGRVLQAMRSYVWVMPREARGCIGCHEDRELTPPNRHVLALRRAPHLVGLGAPSGGSLEPMAPSDEILKPPKGYAPRE